MRYLIAFLLLFLCGCQTESIKVDFKEYYKKLVEVKKPAHELTPELSKFTLSASDMPMKAFIRYFSDTTNTSIVCSEKLDDKLITLDVIEQNIPSILGIVARRLNTEITKAGTLYYIGSLKSSDRGVMVRTVKRFTGEELQSAIESLLSEHGRVITYADGLCIVSDTVEVLNRVNNLLDGIESAPSNSWVVQLFIIEFAKSSNDVFGSKTALNVDLAYNLSSKSSGFVSDGLFSALCEIERTSSDVSIVAQPMFVLIDGSKSTFVSGERVPIAKRTVSDQGTVTTSGYEYVQTGFDLSVGIRESSKSYASLMVNIKMSSIVGFVGNEAPITNEQNFNTVANVKSSGIYLLGSITRSAKSKTVSGILPLHYAIDKKSSEVQIWSKCYKISELSDSAL